MQGSQRLAFACDELPLWLAFYMFLKASSFFANRDWITLNLFYTVGLFLLTRQHTCSSYQCQCLTATYPIQNIVRLPSTVANLFTYLPNLIYLFTLNPREPLTLA